MILWTSKNRALKSLPLFIYWGLWICRNLRIFEDVKPNSYLVGMRIIHHYNEYRSLDKPVSFSRQIEPMTLDQYPVDFFDGAAQHEKGGCGFILFMSGDHYYKEWMGIDISTNNLSELMVALLFWAQELSIKELKIFGDSCIVIDWLLGKSSIKAINLLYWCRRIHTLLTLFRSLSFGHIYREHNVEVDALSMRGIGCMEGLILVEEYQGTIVSRSITHKIY